jgi:hypothetical protein
MPRLVIVCTKIGPPVVVSVCRPNKSAQETRDVAPRCVWVPGAVSGRSTPPAERAPLQLALFTLFLTLILIIDDNPTVNLAVPVLGNSSGR